MTCNWCLHLYSFVFRFYLGICRRSSFLLRYDTGYEICWRQISAFVTVYYWCWSYYLLIYTKLIRSTPFPCLILDKAKGDRVPISTLAVRCKSLKCFAFITISSCWCDFEILSKFVYLCVILMCLSDLNTKFIRFFLSDRTRTVSPRWA